MDDTRDVRDWAPHFAALGAPDPEAWARSQVEEGLPQYARLVFLREAWRNVLAEGETGWIDAHIEEAARRPDAPGSGAGHSLRRLLAAGADPEDLTELVRVMQWQVLAAVMYQISDPGVVECPSDEAPDVQGGLFETDEEGQPLRLMDGLHESVLALDPSGREMRPRRTD